MKVLGLLFCLLQSAIAGAMDLSLDKAVSRHFDQVERLLDAKNAFEAYEAVVRTKEAWPADSEKEIARRIGAAYGTGTALLFYSYEGETLLTWLIDGKGIQETVRSECPRDRLHALANGLRSSLGISSLQASRGPHRVVTVSAGPEPVVSGLFRDTSAAISQVLLPPAIGQKLLSYKTLLIVPVLDIASVPFALLKFPGDQEFLVDHLAIAFAPSLGDITASVRKWRGGFTNPLVVGDPQFAQGEWSLPDLPGARVEAIRVSEIVGGAPLLDDKATGRAVEKRAPAADLLYFATHGVGDPDSPRLRSFLAFAKSKPDEEFSYAQNGSWTMSAIMEHHYKAKLAVLSACQTALGESFEGGIMALGRTFQVQGVPRVVTSLWNIDDDATTLTMVEFMTRVAKAPPAEALRQAMIQTRKKYPDPAKWAPFILFGTAR